MAAPSSTLIALLRHAKRTDDYGWSQLAKALEPHFFKDMSLVDVVSVTLRAYEESLSEKRFEMGDAQCKAVELLLAPIKGPVSIELCGPRTLETNYSVEQFYNAFLKQIMTELRLARVDWLPEFAVQPVSMERN